MIDAHQHFWQLSQPFDYAWLDSPDLEAIRRDYLPNDLKPHLDIHGLAIRNYSDTFGWNVNRCCMAVVSSCCEVSG